MNNLGHSELLEKLEREYGAIVGGAKLSKLMGYQSSAAFRQAFIRNQLPITTFVIPHRKGRFAYTKDVANWLGQLKA